MPRTRFLSYPARLRTAVSLPVLVHLVAALIAVGLAGRASTAADSATALPGTAPLMFEGDLADRMVAGIDRYLDRETAAAAASRGRLWKVDRSSPQAYRASLEPQRARLRKMLGVVDQRVPFTEPEVISAPGSGPEVAKAKRYHVLAVRWPVLPGIEGEGLLLEPDQAPVADIIALPDADWTPEQLIGLAPGVPPAAQYARRLAESGCRVLVPTLIDRTDTWSGNPAIRMTNQPHREWIYRGAFEMGRHVIGYEVQKVLAGLDWLDRKRTVAGSPTRSLGLVGYGEGGLVAAYAAAIDPRPAVTVVSGHFGPREGLWREPIYRNVQGLLAEFGDAELAAMTVPNALVVEACQAPAVSGPPAPKPGRSGAAPGAIITPPLEKVREEVERAADLTRGLKPSHSLFLSGDGDGLPGKTATLDLLLNLVKENGVLAPLGTAPVELRTAFDPRARQKRQVEQLVEFNQRLMREGEHRRRALWAKADGGSVEKWRESTRPYRRQLWDEVIGKLPPPSVPANAQTRLIFDEPKYRGYEVVLDLYPDVIASGILLVPKEIKAGEKRPVVVCQHGLEGRPGDVADPKVDSPYYHRFACRLAEEGFVTFSPQNPYIFGDRFRLLQRKLNPLGKTLFSVIVRQHERILEWLSSQPFVDPERIGFYGLSYGGKTAMRVPALLEQYSLSICSGDFNEWIVKNASVEHRYSYMFTGEWEIFEWDLGNTFNYAEMGWLICPRPFMVERGHDDGVAPSEWVGYEFTKTRERYDRLGIGDRAEIEYFNGPHTIHGVGTFAFLRKHLRHKP